MSSELYVYLGNCFFPKRAIKTCKKGVYYFGQSDEKTSNSLYSGFYYLTVYMINGSQYTIKVEYF
jgi:hypothetical protein